MTLRQVNKVNMISKMYNFPSSNHQSSEKSTLRKFNLEYADEETKLTVSVPVVGVLPLWLQIQSAQS